jgi:cyclic pyranopterin phosphate synthase
VAASLGIRKVRLTGGEPLLHPRILEIVSVVAGTLGIEKVGVTTNGSRLSNLACELKKHGLSAVNISLDSLNAERFSRVTRSKFALSRVLDGLEAALRCGLTVKINVVALSDLSESEIDQFIGLAHTHDIEVRFIEFMPLCDDNWRHDKFLSQEKILSYLTSKHEIQELPADESVSRCYRVDSLKGKIGFISSVTHPFCSECSRLRVTASGELRSCLFEPYGAALRPYLNDENKLIRVIQDAVLGKPMGHGFTLNNHCVTRDTYARIREVGG